MLAATGALAVGHDVGRVREGKERPGSGLGLHAARNFDLTQIQTDVGWDNNNAMYSNMEMSFGFKLNDNFRATLGSSATIPIGISLPDQAADADGNQKSLILAKEISLPVDAKTSYKRLQIITVARFDSSSKLDRHRRHHRRPVSRPGADRE